MGREMTQKGQGPKTDQGPKNEGITSDVSDHSPKVEAFGTGLLLLGGYMALFDLWETAGLLLAVSCILLLMAAFKDKALQRTDLIAFGASAFALAFFAVFLGNGTYIPLAILLAFGVAAAGARTEAFLPGLAGILVIDFLDMAPLMKVVSPALGAVASIFGTRSGMNDAGYLVVYLGEIDLPIFVDEYKLLLPFYASLVIAGAAQIAMMDRGSRLRALPALAVPVFFAAAGTGLFLLNPSPGAFILDTARSLALPLAAVLIFAASIPGGRSRSFQAGKMSRAALAATAAFLIASTAALTPFVTQEDPVVIIDDAHSEWEPMWPDYVQTFEADPISGVNNYHGMLSILSSLYDTTLIVDSPRKVPAVEGVQMMVVDHVNLTVLEGLADGRKAVLVLKCVTTPYTPEEVEAFLQFTSKGNGLILISEHTDIYGMGTHLNPVSERLGYRFLPTGVQDVYTDTRGSITQRGELPALISRYMTGDLLWETGCSLDKVPSAGGRTLFEVYTRPSYFAHYRNETSPFFLTREFTDGVKLNSRFARHLALAGKEYGDGRAVLYTDSTDFNNGIVGFGDHAQIFVGMIEFASAEEAYGSSLLPIIAALLALLALALNRNRLPSTLMILGVLLLSAVALSHMLAAETASFPELKTDPRMTLIEAGPGYMDGYLEGAIDMEKLMDRYFRINQTAVVVPHATEEWRRVSLGVNSLQEALSGINAP